MQVSIAGRAMTVLAGGPSLDLDVEGWVRLPLAAGDPACGECVNPENQTLFAQGQIRLAGLRTSDEQGELSADFSGNLTMAKFDEEPVDPIALLGPGAAVAGVVAATAVVGILAKVLLGGLFTKLSKEKALEHPRRQLLYAYIQEHPGANFRELVRRSDIASGTARHHLSVLKRSGHIVEKPHGGTVRFFENHGKYEASWGSVVLLREEPLKQLHDWLTAHPNVPQKAVLEGMETLGWSRSTTQHRLLRLQHGGLVSMRQQGRLKFYNIASPAVERRFGLPPAIAQPGTMAA
jgi:predicted transcriptional regulator